jgi:hypothetical protein
MNARKLTKEVTIGDKRYQLKKIDARSACWMFAFLGGKSNGGSIITGLGACTRSEFDEIQTLVLRPVVCLDNSSEGNFEIPIFSGPGNLVDENLRDAGNLFMITSEAIIFNLEPFLFERGSNSLQQTQSDGNQ